MAHLRKGTTAVRNSKAPDHLNKLNNHVPRYPASRDRFGTIIKTLDAVTRGGKVTPKIKERLEEAKALAELVKADAERNGSALSQEMAEHRLRQANALRRYLDEALQQMNEPMASVGANPPPSHQVDVIMGAYDMITALIGLLLVMVTRRKDRE